MDITPDKLALRVLREECGSGAYERGLAYFEQGRAQLQQAVTRPDGAVLLAGVNQGSANRRYEQDIEINADAEGLYVVGECSCPVGFNCKHVVATCLAWKAQKQVDVADDGEFEGWLARYAGKSSAEARPESLLYVLKPAGTGSQDLLVDFIVARLKLDGNWGKGRKAGLSTLHDHWARPAWMQSIDGEIVALLLAANTDPWQTRITLSGAAGDAALNLMLDTDRVFWGDDRSGPLCRGEARDAELAWKNVGQYWRLQLSLDAAVMIPTRPPWYADPELLQAGRLNLPAGLSAARLDLLRQAPRVGPKDADRVSRLLARDHPELPTPKPVPMDEIHQPPVPRLRLALDPEQPLAGNLVLDFLYGSVAVNAAAAAEVVVDDSGQRLQRFHRDQTAESAARETLLQAGLVAWPESVGQFGFEHQADSAESSDGAPASRPEDRNTVLGRWFDFLETTVPELEAKGWRIEQSGAGQLTVARAEAIEGEVESTGNDWFSLRFDLEVDGWLVPLLPLVSDLLEDYRPGALPQTLYLDAGQGQLIAVAASRIEPILQTIVDLFDHDHSGETLRLSRLDATSLLDLGETRLKGAAKLRRLARRMRDFSGIKPVKVPTTFKGQLRDYQQHGLNWLQFLREFELGGILADDMGLGKTIQTLANLAVEKRAGRMRQPSLIIAPTSLMGNWRREAALFTPNLKVLVLHGPDRADWFDAIEDHDVVLSTYPLLPRDHEALLARQWHYLILDEAQQIKNPRAKAAQYVRAIKANHRLCLTGTPMENHLGELWAQFDFLMPGFLGDPRQFARNYRTPIEQHDDRARLERLARRTAPFMLRRTKDRVAAELPRKSEFLRATPIEGKQATLYESIRLAMEKKVSQAIARKGLARSHIMILDALLKLRQVCCDPRLLPAATRGASNAPSAKLEMLMDMLPELLDEGRRILLFSQFTTMLGLIEQEITSLGISYTKLTGQTRKRDAAIERFRSGEVNLFLISLKAGGVGLNLTEADTVIHYDPWWNPAVETQATDRAHRIGQDKPVFVYKLVTEGTVEEKILALQERKRQLADSVYASGGGSKQLPIDAETLTGLLSGD